MTIRGSICGVLVVLAGWIGILAGVTLLKDDAPAALVMFPTQDFLADMPSGVAILDATSISVTLASDDQDLALQLYRQGARLVLPAGLSGCSPSGVARLPVEELTL